MFSVGVDELNSQRSSRMDGGRLEVERRDGGGMDSLVDLAKDLTDMGLGVGDDLFHDVEIRGSRADI